MVKIVGLAVGGVDLHVRGVMLVQAAKRALADAILGTGQSALTELTDRELSDLVSLRRET